MQAFLEFVGKWAHLIGEIWGKYPVAAAIFTGLAVYVLYVVAEDNGITFDNLSENWTKASLFFLAALLVWSICVPILGLFLDWLDRIKDLLIFVYKLFAERPIFVLAALLICGTAGAIWAYTARRSSPNAYLKGLITVVVWLVLVLFGVPIMRAVFPLPAQDAQAPTKEVKEKHATPKERTETGT
jgi:hypothetical protein